MAKSCHDIDLLSYWMEQDTCTSIHSYGSLQHFQSSKKPQAAGDATRCLDCAIKNSCAYSAPRFYLDPNNKPTRWTHALTPGVPDLEDVLQALREGPYGRCVYEHDNDVVDHQVVTMEYASGATACFSMVATTKRLCQRETAVYGSKGELKSLDELSVVHYDFESQQEIQHQFEEPNDIVLRGHGGADHYCATAFVEAVRKGDPSLVLTSPQESLKSHTLVFAAEQARLERKVLDLRSNFVPTVP